MIPVTQTLFGGPDGPTEEIGNCWAACVASLLELPLAVVPDGLRTEKDDLKRWEVYQAFLKPYGFCPVTLTFEGLSKERVAEWWARLEEVHVQVIGKSPRGNYDHGVIYRNGELAHDPHPDGNGVLTIDFVEIWAAII